MQAELAKLLGILNVEQKGTSRFEGRCRGHSGQRVYGGLVLAQAFLAAGRTVPNERVAHSLHAYFLRPGDDGAPIGYEVERTRDGGSFSTRRVVATQSDQPIFVLTASFQIEEPGESHQLEMPAVTPPEELEDEYHVLMQHMEEIPEACRSRIFPEYPIRFRLTCSENPIEPPPNSSSVKLWMKAEGVINGGALMHQALLLYASDHRLLSTSLRPHERSVYQGNTMIASLDHSMWFHRPVRFDEWMLYHVSSPSAQNARGLSLGSIFSRNGVLVASVAQEGLIRPIDS